MRDLTCNNIVFGECTSDEQKAFQLVGRGGCEYRAANGWEGCKAGLQGMFAEQSTYRIKAFIYRGFEEHMGVWCLEADGGYVVYTSSPAVLKLDGVKVEFQGYGYEDSVVLTKDPHRRGLPDRGVWRRVC